MHRQSDKWSRVDGPIFTPVEQQIRKRIWYACVVMDKYVSTYIGRPLSIFETDYDTQLPGVDEVSPYALNNAELFLIGYDLAERRTRTMGTP